MTVAPASRDESRLWLAAIVLVGLVLRIAGAQGGLWLDEAWSARLAHDAGTPIGVFLHINHDNNHHLNSLWLQFVGFGAPSILARALSIVSGTLAIVAAAWIAASRGRAAMLVTAWLFAVSPILVTLGSEARGYAPMSLALLIAIAMIDRRLRGDGRPIHVALALCFFLGALAQLTMVFGVCALLGWHVATLWAREGAAAAIRRTFRLFALPLAALAAALLLVFVPAMLSPTGFQIGRYDPFDLMQYLHGVIEMIGYTVAVPIDTAWLVVAVLAMVILARSARVSRLGLYWFSIAAFPLALALLHSGNVAHPRYYLVAGIAILLLVADVIAIGWRQGSVGRGIAIAALGALSLASIALDIDLARNRRGDPAAAIAAMQARAPAGSVVMIDRSTASAMLDFAAAQDRYPVILQEAPCPARRFLLLDRFRGEAFPARIDRCGAQYLPIDGRRARGLSGTHWTLYERRR